MAQVVVAFVDASNEAVRAARFASSFAASAGAHLVIVAPMERPPAPRPAMIPRQAVEEIRQAADLEAWVEAGRTLDEIRRDPLVCDEAEVHPLDAADDPIASLERVLAARECLLLVFPREGPWTVRTVRSTVGARSSLPVAVVP